MAAPNPPSEAGSLDNRELGAGRTVIAEVPVTLPTASRKSRQRAPQQTIDEFWDKFTTKAPGKATTVIPHNPYARVTEADGRRRLRDARGQGAHVSYEEAAAACRAKVAQIVRECRRVNQKYRDPHFDLEWDLKCGTRDTLESLCNDARCYPSSDDEDSDSSSSSSSVSRSANGGTGRRRRRKAPPRPGPGADFQPQSVKRVVDIFDDPKFYIDGPAAGDVRQGCNGDCWFLAALCTLSNKPSLIERVCVARDEAVGVYGFVFHRDGGWVSEIIDDKLFLTKPDWDEDRDNLERWLWEDGREREGDSEEQYRRTYQSGSGALYFAQCAHAAETWLPLLEKAYAKAHGDYAAIEGGFTGEGLEDLTGGVTTELWTADILDRERFWRDELLRVNDQFLFGCNTDLWDKGTGNRNGLVENHAYSVTRAVEIDGQRLVLLKNPWGKSEWKGPWSDGSKEWTAEWLTKLDHRFGDDGAFWISYRDLLRKYQVFDRTRLFGPEWRVASLWTTLAVPWAPGYHGTHFAFTLARPGPVVLALSQLDDRYYRGLQGQYEFALDFRLHRTSPSGSGELVPEDEYIVRSPRPYYQRRSVSVELPALEAGEYAVLVRVRAARDHRCHTMATEEVVRRNARDRRDKLVAVGMSYDLAHSKGGRVVTVSEEVEEWRRRARQEAAKRAQEEDRRRRREEFLQDQRDMHYLRSKERQRDRARLAKRKAKKAAKQAAREEAAAAAARGREGAATKKEKADAPEDAEKKPATSSTEEASASKENEDVTPPSSSEPSADTPSTITNESPGNDIPPELETVPKPNDTSDATAEAKPDISGPEKSKDEDAHSARYDPGDHLAIVDDSDDDDLSSVWSFSEMSEHEIDVRLRRAISPRPPPQRATVDPDDSDNKEPDKFERDPWNAVATVGLRVYYMAPSAESEAEGKEDKSKGEATGDEEIVKLRVVHPNPYRRLKEKQGGKASTKGDGKNDNVGEDSKEKKGEGEERSTEVATETAKEPESPQALDVDDSAKDATHVEGQK